MEIKYGCSISEQNEEFQKFFYENIMQHIDFAESCVERDEYQRPSVWYVGDLKIVATYFTENENYNFNTFVIYENI